MADAAVAAAAVAAATAAAAAAVVAVNAAAVAVIGATVAIARENNRWSLCAPSFSLTSPYVRGLSTSTLCRCYRRRRQPARHLRART